MALRKGYGVPRRHAKPAPEGSGGGLCPSEKFAGGPLERGLAMTKSAFVGRREGPASRKSPVM
jgi:hypothetical protein